MSNQFLWSILVKFFNTGLDLITHKWPRKFRQYGKKDVPENFKKRLRDSQQKRNQELELLFKKIKGIVRRQNINTLYENFHCKVKGYEFIPHKIISLKLRFFTYV